MYAIEQVRAPKGVQRAHVLEHCNENPFPQSNFANFRGPNEKKFPPCSQGLALENRSPQIDGVLGALLAKLEKDKPTINLGTDDKQHCENFAVRVFTRADKIDRAGHADKTTATTYYAASIFIEVSQMA